MESQTRKRNGAAKKPRAPRVGQTVPAPNRDDVAARAYELFCQRGGAHGDDWHDWLSAERQLMPKRRPDVRQS